MKSLNKTQTRIFLSVVFFVSKGNLFDVYVYAFYWTALLLTASERIWRKRLLCVPTTYVFVKKSEKKYQYFKQLANLEL